MSIILTSCGSLKHTVPNYSLLPDNIALLKHKTSNGIYIKNVKITGDAKLVDLTCSGMFAINFLNNVTLSEYLKSSINNELKIASIYNENEKYLIGEIERVIHRQHGMTRNTWEIDVKFLKPDEESIFISISYEFETIHTCPGAALFFMNAIQEINKTLYQSDKFIRYLEH